MKRKPVVALTLLAALIVGFAWFGRPTPEAPTAPSAANAQPGIGETDQQPSLSRGPAAGTDSRSARVSRRSAPGLASGPGQAITFREDHGYEPEEFAQDRMAIYESFQQSVRDWTPEIFAEKTAYRDQLTGREAYEVYVYLRSCLGQPDSVQQVERRIDRLERFAGQQPEQAEDILNQIDAMSDELARCENVGTDGTGIPLLHNWLALSADLGFAQAQLAYHLSARWVLSMQPDELFRQPQLALDYRGRASDYLQAAIRAGHPDALLEYARAINDDIVFQRDPAAVYAYAYAAEQGGGGMDGEATAFLEQVEPELEPSELRDARERGRALCERYCRP